MRPASELPVLHVTAEYHPYAQSGGLGGAVRGLAEHQRRTGRPVTVLLPYYQQVRTLGHLVEEVATLLVPMGPGVLPARLLRHMHGDDLPEVLFLDIPSLYERKTIYGEDGDYRDNHVRFAALGRAAVELLRLRALAGGDPTVLHAHDWHASLAPVYLRVAHGGEPWARRTPAILNVHNAGYQGQFPASVMPSIGLPWGLYRWDLMEWYGRLDYLKGGLVFCDAAVTVSARHADELRTDEGGFGLQGQFRAMGDRLSGIRNGIEPELWDPMHDVNTAAPFHQGDLAGKAACKADLQRRAGFRVDPALPLLVFCGRLVTQKGLELVVKSSLLRFPGAQFAFLGHGEDRFIEAIGRIAQQAPDRVLVRTDFRDDREHRMLAGADMLLMPSYYEPCGLTQMRCQRYGTLPLVRWVGGLADTVVDDVSGFVFGEYTVPALEAAFARALGRFAEPLRWRAMMRFAMTRDFSWTGPSRAYDEVYARALARHGA
ncbi:MAG: glycogen/starch synthase [Gemmatimonadales bacterium]|nr:glycogen/starch synthase [Gemmatimonadales bacterium]